MRMLAFSAMMSGLIIALLMGLSLFATLNGVSEFAQPVRSYALASVASVWLGLNLFTRGNPKLAQESAGLPLFFYLWAGFHFEHPFFIFISWSFVIMLAFIVFGTMKALAQTIFNPAPQ